MRKRIFIFYLLFFSYTLVNAQFNNSFYEAQKNGIALNKLLLLDFTASWSGSCKAMNDKVWSQPEIKTLLKNFIYVKIDIDKEKDLAKEYSITLTPSILIVDANGLVLSTNEGYIDKEKLKIILKKYSLNTSFLQNELLAFFTEKSGKNALRLVEKYMDFSSQVNDEIKNDILRVSAFYLHRANKKFKTEENIESSKQQIVLLKIYRSLLKENYKEVFTALKKNLNDDEVEEVHKSFYEFLYFTYYTRINDSINAKKWYQRLITRKDASYWLQKSRKTI